jgi:hypothetical protein
MAKFKRPGSAAGRATQPQKVRDARAAQLAELRGKEKAPTLIAKSNAFVPAVAMAKQFRQKKGKRNGK